ncbi:RNA recognition motif domain-containing protein [Myxococcota bacterium]
MKIYVGNLPFSIDDAALEELFKQHGTVDSAKVITDRDTGRSRGFGFVEMEDDEEGQKAIDATNGTEIEGRALTVNKARPQKKREKRGGGGGGGRDRW